MVALTSPDLRDSDESETMRPYTKVLLGGVGALMPTIAVFLATEGSTIVSFDEPASFIGYGLRVSLLFLIGGLWVWLHKTEHDPVKVFQLGIVAPAMITGVIQAENVSGPSKAEEARLFQMPSFSLISTAHAESEPVRPVVSPGSKPTFRCIVKGFLGRKC